MRSKPDEIVERVSRLNFHDDKLVDIRIHPPRRELRGMESSVEIDLARYRDEKIRHLRFSGCANLRLAMDFDILAGNLFPNTDWLSAHTNTDKMRKLVRSLNLDNIACSPWVLSPFRTKLEKLDNLVFFHIAFFGGKIDILARNFKVKLAR